MQAAADHLKRVLTRTAETENGEDFDLLAALHKSELSYSYFAIQGKEHEVAYNLHDLCPAGQLPEQTPWFENFRQEFLRMLAFSDLDTIDQPVACEAQLPVLIDRY